MRRFSPLIYCLLPVLSGCGQSERAPQSAAPNAKPVNYGATKPTPVKPFRTKTIATFDTPWALAFLPDRRMLVTEKPGHLWIVTPDGSKTEVGGVPAVHFEGQGGLLFVATSPTFGRDHRVYLTYSEPGASGDGLALAMATFGSRNGKPALLDLRVIWRQLPRGNGGQFGGYIAFSPDGQHLFLTSGDRQRFDPAQDPNQALGKILRLTLDGKPAAGNPGTGKTGTATVNVIDSANDSDALLRSSVRRESVPTPNLTPAETWSTGHRNSYGLAFDDAGRLWETEMGPRGGDELNLIEPGKNYGWPISTYGRNYDGTPIAKPGDHPGLKKPVLYWDPVIAPAGFAFYRGNMFPQWRGSAFVGGLAVTSLIRIAFDGINAREAERWDMGARIRAVMAGPDGALWLLEDDGDGKLVRLTTNRGG
ncbi:PQQ-dependent sugar dehydrogenase [Sphingomonas sp. 4RDLI-65]|uniref:PQQ-dependent sugar dehydrogenase n=1 Tax=Sphingomonas sp. 4RDLI-65 TaxID=3111641 RepID=UPI003C1B84C1